MISEYRISELAEKAGVSKRTIHYYISKGLIPPALGAGVNSTYNDEHLYRVMYIKALQSQYFPLDKIKTMVTGLSLNDVREKIEEQLLVQESNIVKTSDSPLEMIEKKNMSFYEEENQMIPHGLMVDAEEYIRLNLGGELELHFPKSAINSHGDVILNIVKYAKRLMGEE